MAVYLSQRVLVEYDQNVLLSKQNNLKFRNLMNLKMKDRKNHQMKDKRQQVLLLSLYQSVGSSEGPKAIDLGKCPDPIHKHDAFGVCKPVTPLDDPAVDAEDNPIGDPYFDEYVAVVDADNIFAQLADKAGIAELPDTSPPEGVQTGIDEFGGDVNIVGDGLSCAVDTGDIADVEKPNQGGRDGGQ
jgi:hypothetical protein